MNYKRNEIDNCVIHTIKTDVFKTINISINFRRESNREELAIVPFLFNLLTYSTKNYNYKKLIEKREDLFNLRIDTKSMIESSKYRNDSIDINFIHPNYSFEKIEDDVIDLLKEIILNPNLDNKDYFEEIKTFISREIISLKNNKREYAKEKLFENMEPNSQLSYSKYGTLEDLNNVTIEKIKQIYYEIINNSQIDIMIVGDIDTNKYENYFSNIFMKNKRFEKLESPLYIDIPKQKEIYIEDTSLNQSKLEIGLRVLNLNEKTERALVNLYRIILGAGPTSKLFLEVREKHSLAYYSNAYIEIRPLLYIESGIDGDNYKKTVELIIKLMKDMENATNEELEIAKKTYISSLKNIEYSLSNISSFYYQNEITKYYELDINTIIDEVKNVTIDNVRDFSKKVYIDTILLYGVKDE